MICLFILLIIFIILLYSTKRNNNLFLSKDTTDVYKAIAAILIVLHHISQYIILDISLLNLIFSKIGYFCTAIFIFLSGYGNFISYKKIEKESLNLKINWILKRILKIIFDYLFVFFISISCIFILNEEYTINSIVESLLKLALPGWINWYLKIQLMLYVMFAIVYMPNKFNDKNKNIIMLGLTLVYILLMKLNDFGQYWYNTVLCFNLGIFIAEQKDSINFAKNTKLAFLLCSLFSFFIFWIISIFWGKVEIICSLLLCLVLTFITFYIHINSKKLKYISKYSLEIYLTHLIILNIVKNMNFNSNLKILIIFAFTFIFSVISSKFSNFLLNGLKLDKKVIKERA